MLVARITEKRAELENLKQLRDLSAAVAAQMQTLEEKLSMLSDGTEGLFPCPSWSHVLTWSDGLEYSRGYGTLELA